MRFYSLSLPSGDIEILESTGQGPAVVFCHGNSGAADTFAGLLESELGARYRLIALSFPGHGVSSAAADPENDYSIPRLGEFVATVVRALALPNYVLVGQSLGGHALLEALDQFPGARGLVLLSAPPLTLASLSDAFQPDPSDGALFAGELDEAVAARLAACFVAHADAAVLTRLQANIRRTDPRFRPALLHSLQRGDMRDEMAALARAPWPVALLQGGRDRFLRADYFAAVPAGFLWRGAPVVFAEQGHALHLDAPQAFMSVLESYLADVLPSCCEAS